MTHCTRHGERVRMCPDCGAHEELDRTRAALETATENLRAENARAEERTRERDALVAGGREVAAVLGVPNVALIVAAREVARDRDAALAALGTVTRERDEARGSAERWRAAAENFTADANRARERDAAAVMERDAALALLRRWLECDALRPRGLDLDTRALLARYEAPPPAPVREEATHRCKVCGALWEFVKTPKPGHMHDVSHSGFWSLRSPTCGPCCDNAPMGEQIEALPAPARDRDAEVRRYGPSDEEVIADMRADRDALRERVGVLEDGLREIRDRAMPLAGFGWVVRLATVALSRGGRS